MTESRVRPYTNETPEVAENAMRHLHALLTRVRAADEGWHQAAIAPVIGSTMHAADRLNTYEHASQHIHNYIEVALDNIESALGYLESKGELPLIALYSMIRGSIEASSNGLWILQGKGKFGLAWRGLQRSYKNHEDLCQLEISLGADSAGRAKMRNDVKKSLEGMQEGMPPFKQANIFGIPQITQIVEAAEKSVNERFHFSAVQAWRACSGMAHGNFAVQRALWESEEQGESKTGRGIAVQFRSRVALVSSLAAVSVENLEALISLYSDACMPIDRSPRA
ncbi:hypothetical protein [Arthrobacter bambusae]|uniref:hypothetical protein n=1 Tax=Arthrobacter bambusae TaxID=1338426 RepID=UPI002789AC2C|nr:hypothetical protein [Arthrobacter bambusae]MDQ0212530.1 hypothetical protein [Arthrobacter bambusae]MDQ0235964.1 hypothetical protein [Arthrobacter bambusae]